MEHMYREKDEVGAFRLAWNFEIFTWAHDKKRMHQWTAHCLFAMVWSILSRVQSASECIDNTG